MFRTGDDTKKKGIEHTLGIFIKLARGFRIAEIEAKKDQKRAEELDGVVHGKSGRQSFSGKNGTHAGDVERVEGLPDFVELLGQMALGIGAHIKEDAGIIGILLKEGEPETEDVPEPAPDFQECRMEEESRQNTPVHRIRNIQMPA